MGTVCEFTTCASPCKTCQGSASSCRSCVSGFNLYLTSCVEMCPSGTYSLNQSCVAINESITYFPITICSIFIFLIAVAMRIYSNRKIGNVSRSVRRNSFSSEIGASVNIQEPTINYKLNVIRLMAVFMAYL